MCIRDRYQRRVRGGDSTTMESPERPQFEGMPEGSTLTMGPAAASHARAAMQAWKGGWPRVSISVQQRFTEDLENKPELAPSSVQFSLAPDAHDLSTGFRQWRSAKDAGRAASSVLQAWAHGGDSSIQRWKQLAGSLKVEYTPAATQSSWNLMASKLQLRPPVLRKQTTLMAEACEQKGVEMVASTLSLWKEAVCESSTQAYYQAGASVRRWKSCAGTQRQPGSLSLRVVQYNVLADVYAKPDWFPYCNPAYLGWDYRKANLMMELIAMDADILCLQEVDRYGDFFLPELRCRGYRGVFAKRPHKQKRDGCAVFYKHARLKKKEDHSIQLNDLVRRGGNRFATNNVAQLLSFEVDGADLLYVLNVHLYHSPEAVDVKVGS
eukprot:TRINITY_DN9854_c0_g1_i4.p1 TRINITY_DN9854_c0_g1~~TRINITY_DN9854_c0_g1_i4.p1  ORF type:complete len:380 (+),score=103.24 TRINITY_DN9854_c0_g1_i4:147-1286(+)